ncbi:hypothetical protein PG994_008585 [Apiospora phragmitis]|uniref:Uncharacterized protein n=1 Tax=Apiospora phragmitis TaxID=2905665 RepID=A0ABR1UGX0_9PEZI
MMDCLSRCFAQLESSTSVDKPLPPLPQHGAADIELQEHSRHQQQQQQQQQPLGRISSTRRSNTVKKTSEENTTTADTATSRLAPVALPGRRRASPSTS